MGGSLDEATIAAIAKAVDEMKPAQATTAKRDSYLDWLLHKPVSPAVPAVQDVAWVKNPVDAFVLSKLEARGLTPAPPAEKGPSPPRLLRPCRSATHTGRGRSIRERRLR